MFGLFTGCSSLFPVFLDELHGDADRIRGLVFRHRTDIGVAAALQFADRLHQQLRGDFLLFEHDREALLFEGTGIEDLVASACLC